MICYVTNLYSSTSESYCVKEESCDVNNGKHELPNECQRKRRLNLPVMSNARQKRQRTGIAPFGEASEADSPSAQNNLPSSSSFCTRVVPVTQVPLLTTLCARIFVANLRKLSRHENGTWEATRRWLKLLPDTLVPRLFTMLRDMSPGLLNSAFISAVRDFS